MRSSKGRAEISFAAGVDAPGYDSEFGVGSVGDARRGASVNAFRKAGSGALWICGDKNAGLRGVKGIEGSQRVADAEGIAGRLGV